MINPQDLRIGNYLMLENGEFLKVNYETIRCLVVLQDKPNYKSIPLTEEILFKCGFTNIGNNYEKEWLLIHTHLPTGEFHFLLNEPNTGKYKITNLKHLHQLQNLYYCLTGKELEVKL